MGLPLGLYEHLHEVSARRSWLDPHGCERFVGRIDEHVYLDLERRPSSLGLDHGWCVYSKPGEPCRVHPPYLKEPKRQFLCSHTKKHDNGVHIIPPVFTSFLSPLDYTCSSKGVYTHTSTLGHTVMPLHATHHR
jgi:hypothetical protein